MAFNGLDEEGIHVIQDRLLSLTVTLANSWSAMKKLHPEQTVDEQLEPLLKAAKELAHAIALLKPRGDDHAWACLLEVVVDAVIATEVENHGIEALLQHPGSN